MGFQRKVPSTKSELREYLEKLHKNRAHITSIKVSPESGRLEVDLDGKANFFGYPDIYLPIKKESIAAANALVEHMIKGSKDGFAPSDADAQQLFDMIDPQAR